MPITTAEQFLVVLEQSNLLKPSLLERLRRKVHSTDSKVEPRRVAKGLVEKGVITPWQARQLLSGRNAFYLGRYKLLDRIGKGGMGVVFKAQHAVMDRVVALKVMSHSLLKNPRAVARFNREVKTAAALKHANIITAYDADSVGNTHFLVMEYVEGRDLNHWLRNVGPLPISVACECAYQVSEGLGHAFHQGMVHRDIKPVNLVVTWNTETSRPVIKILDMGLARFVSEAREEGGVTRAGQTIGTPDYIAPEAAQNFKQADIRSDIFSLGCTLFKLLTGKLPFSGDNTMEKLMARTTQDAPLANTLRSEIPAELADVVAKMLARDPQARFQNPAELCAALAPFTASARGDSAALAMFSSPPKAAGTADAAIEADADSSLEEFFRDFSVSPLRDDGSPSVEPAATRASESAGFSLAEDEEEELGFADEPVPMQPAASKLAEKSTTAKTGAKPAPPKPATATPAVAKPADAKTTDKAPSKPSSGSLARPPAPPSLLDDLVEDDAQMAILADEVGALDPVDLDSAATSGPLESPRTLSRSEKRLPNNNWDSMLILAGGGALIFMLILGGAIYWYLGRESSDEMLKVAEENYTRGSYTQAIRQFESFLTDNPNHPRASMTRVHLGMAKIRQAVDSGGNWGAHLDLASGILKDISSEKDFPEARSELTALLPSLAQKLSEQAAKDKSTDLVAKSRRALELVDQFVPKAQRPENLIEQITTSLALTEHAMQRDKALAEAVTRIQEAVKGGDATKAYDLRRQLLKNYPDLATDATLQEAILAATQTEREAVRRIDPIPPDTSEPPTTVLAEVSLDARTAGKADGVDGQVVPVLAEGAVYGVDASTGAVRWRRFVGFDSPFAPVSVAKAAGSDIAYVDSALSELVCVAGPDGAIRWRQRLDGQASGPPILLRDRIVAATRSGHVASFEVRDGKSAGDFVLPQPLEISPTVGPRERLLYQVADQSNLYLLSLTDGTCPEVYYLGHSKGSIHAPPLVFSSLSSKPAFVYVVVAENRGAHNAVLRILVGDENGLGLKPIGQEIPLEGHVHVPLLSEGRMMHVITDRGALYSFEINTPDQPSPVTNVVSRAAASEDHVVRYALLQGSQLWIADDRLTKFDFQPALGRLDARWVVNQQDVFTQPLQAMGSLVFTVRKREGMPGATVAAVRAADGTPAWETNLAVPLADAPIVDANQTRLTAIGVTGDVYAVQPPESGRQVSEPVAQVKLQTLLATDAPATQLPAGFAVGGSNGRQGVMWINPAQPQQARLLSLPGTLACPTIRWRDGLVTASRDGLVSVIDPASGRNLLEPFQPRLESGMQLAWTEPAAVDNDTLLIFDGAKTLYRLTVANEPKPHLDAASQITLDAPIVSPIAVLGDVAYAVDSVAVLSAFTTRTLESQGDSKLSSPVAWGPRTMGDAVLLTTRDDQMLCLDGVLNVRWKVELPFGPLAGPPQLAGDNLLAASASGVVWKMAMKTGEILSKIELGRPLASSVVSWRDQCIATGHDGTLYLIKMP